MLIPIEHLSESPLNTRKLFGDLSELAASIKLKGVLQSILVRPLEKGRYEIVAGHRRVRAAKLAGLEEVPADVRDLTDEEVVEISVIENCQRKDINPVEEGEGYKALFEKYKKPVVEIAAAVNKSEAHVRQRMQLVQLPKDALDALAGDQLSVTVALALARLPDPKVRTEASKEVLAGDERSDWKDGKHLRVREPFTIKEALQLIREKYNLRLDEHCGFNLFQSNLVPSAGACETCPKRSLNNPVLFPDLAPQDDLCTDPACFAKKKEAGWKQRKVELEAAGRKVLEGKAAAEVIGDYGQVRGGYMRLSDHDYNDPKHRSAEQILGKKNVAEHIVVAVDKAGKTHELVPKAEVSKALKEKLKEAGLKTNRAAAAPKVSEKEKAEREQMRLKTAARDRTLLLTMGAIVGGAQSDANGLWQLVAELLIDALEDSESQGCETALRRGLLKFEEVEAGYAGHEPVDPKTAVPKLLKADLAKQAENGARGMALELALEMCGVYSSWGTKGKELLDRVCRLFGVDAKRRKAIEKEAMDLVKKGEEAKGAAAAIAKKGECILDPGKPKACKTCKEKHCAGKAAK